MALVSIQELVIMMQVQFFHIKASVFVLFVIKIGVHSNLELRNC